MITLYYLLLSLALATVGPYLLLSRKARAGISQKLGFIPKALLTYVSTLPASCPRIWFHAVSVGEFNALFPLLEKFHQEHPEWQIFVSTTTATGQELARSRTSGFAQVFYFPLDLPWMVSKWLKVLKPNLVAIIETEIWPGFMTECQNKNIKVVLLNGRLSPRSFKGYMRWKWFFAPVLAKFSAIAVQSESELERYIALSGARSDLRAGDNWRAPASSLPIHESKSEATASSEALTSKASARKAEKINKKPRIEVCGNIKLDGIKSGSSAESLQIRQRLNLKANDLIVVGGSTHEGEESALLSCLKELNGRFRLILAPRHPERFDRGLQLIESYGFRARRYSKQEGFASDHDVYLLDTIGQLNKFYGLANIAFVGGTLANIGGHNLVEPCAYKSAVICGPNIHKTKDLFQKLQEREALLMVPNEKELISTIKLLLDSPAKRHELGENGFNFLAENQGALAKTLALLEEYLDTRGPSPHTTIETAGRVHR